MKNGLRPILLACCALRAAEIIDRVAVSVGNQVITESQIDAEIRLTRFLNGDKPGLPAGERKNAADRLIEQALVKREMELSHYPLPELNDADPQLRMLKARYTSEAQFRDALQSYRIDEDELRQRLWWQLTLLRFVEYRFRPGIQVQDAEVQAYYKKQVATWQQESAKAIPSLEEVRGQIAEVLTEQRIDQELDRWLQEARMQVTIRYLDEALR